MADLISTLSFAASGMETQARRLQHVSENIANADTPGYRRKLVNFQQMVDGVTAGDVTLDQSDLAQIFDPGNPLADQAGYYSGSNVDLVIEVADAREAQRSYEANLKVFDQARQMTQGLFELLRR
ncbi:MAG: flagellar basal body rod protein FlgC [Microgenomates group bacterium]|jgi:flagellar basal-body rod protein FlgC